MTAVTAWSLWRAAELVEQALGSCAVTDEGKGADVGDTGLEVGLGGVEVTPEVGQLYPMASRVMPPQPQSRRSPRHWARMLRSAPA